MLSANVLCLKKKKKKSYCIANKSENGISSTDKPKRSTTMLQITEDTPPDMLAGAMDLTVHLPTGRTVKMSVERSTPMMDLLVQITTNYHLQLSGYTLQALGMAPSKEHGDTILPYKPNTPIGALDTQHIRVVPKARNVSVPKNVPPGHQPFESTFRLKVHLPRNQLYVVRVSQSVHLEEIMKKVCEEKNLDPVKYEFRHPANLDEILDPKLTLSDYAITEIYLLQKGIGSLNQTFSSNDIMTLRKEEERKQMHNKTGGGVFNLIFRRGKSSTGSLSSDNRSISPTHSDDSRSVTPPGVQQQIIAPPVDPPAERPKPPQRKRRPAPKPPTEPKKTDSTLTICHSRNSSDSSGYHEASILSDNCNTSLPRRPKSTVISEESSQKAISGQYSQSTSNLSKMSTQSKSTSSLAVPSRKKKTAPPPPPPPVLKPAENAETNLEDPSPVVASQPCTVAQAETPGNGQDSSIANTNPKPKPRTRIKNAPSRPRSTVSINSEECSEAINDNVKQNKETMEAVNVTVKLDCTSDNSRREISIQTCTEFKKDGDVETTREINKTVEQFPQDNNFQIEHTVVIEEKQEVLVPEHELEPIKENLEDINENIKQKVLQLAELQKEGVNQFFGTAEKNEKVEPPQVIALHPKSSKTNKDVSSKSIFDSYSRKRGFQIGSSLIDLQDDETKNSSGMSTPTSIKSALNSFDFVDEIDGIDVDMFNGSMSKNSKKKNLILNQLHGIHELENESNKGPKYSAGSLRSINSLPGFVGSNMKKWKNMEELDDISLHSCGGRSGWVIGDTSDTESIISTTNTSQKSPLDSLTSVQQSLPSLTTTEKTQEEISVSTTEKEEKDNDLETDWQYQLPSPPKDFRDSSPVPFTETNHESIADSVVTSPELFEKLKEVKDNQSEKETVSDLTSMVSEEEKPILNKLSLENLEKRKSLVYNRELATSLKMSEERKIETFGSSLANFEKTYDEVKKSSPKQTEMTSTLPNFKITTYNPKQKLNIFEDDTVRSNTDRSNKPNSFTESTFALEKSYIGRSMENISFRKNSVDSEDNKKVEYSFFRPPISKAHNVLRSESFSKEQTWVPTKPVTRSKSQVALNKYKETKNVVVRDEDNLTKSNSLFDVSGLQSLGVMRLIQNKLNTPNHSSETLDIEESYQKQPESKREVQNQPEEKPMKSFRYSPPAINMSTWSERPKIPVNVKDDPDYKYSVKDTNTSKLIVNTVNNDIKSHNSIEIRNKPTTYTNGVSVRIGQDTTDKSVNVKVNGYEQVNHNSGNVVIKIGGNTKPVFRKPLGNVNSNQRPHSVAFGNDFDISRVPIVRSVEFKKPYKDIQTTNTSITQIVPSDEEKKETAPKPETKPVFRVNSFLQNSSAPVVRGFRSANEANRMSWSQPHSFSTLPAKNFALSTPIPFSQANLRRTESTHVETKSNQPPPAPMLPKTFSNGNVKNRENCGDPKEQLLQAIRDFGGKKGLRAVKA